MRRGFFLFLMVLLVLRGLTSTAMAAGMVTPMGAAAYPAQALGHAASATHPDHGHDHGPGQQEEQDGAMSHHGGQAHHAASSPCIGESGPACDSGPAHHAGACTACEICHSAALTPPALASPLLHAAAHVVPGASARFDSAPVSRTVKPPIS